MRRLVDERQAPGTYRMRWDGRNDFGGRLTSGVYLYRINAGDFVAEKKMVLLQ
ncbi:MAG: hypothetical protein ACRENG_16750 [bacterium]